jgi:hypothetical protein
LGDVEIEMSNVVLKPLSITVVITGVNFRNYAIRYNRAVSLYSETDEEPLPFDPIPYQLVCQSIELHLKSFIWIKEKYGRNKFRDKYGHNIIKLWNHCKARNIEEFIEYGDQEDSAISLIGNEYKNRQFCYLDLDMTYEVFPELNSKPEILATLIKLSDQLGEKLKRPLYDASQPE